MNTSAAQQQPVRFEILSWGRDVIRTEAAALSDLAATLGEDFRQVVEAVLNCRGSVLVTGMGKCGYIAQKISATLASTGTPSHFLHPAEAIHGDLGRIGPGDLLLVLSFSGETAEIVDILPSLRNLSAGILAFTASRHTTLGKYADTTIELGALKEAGEHQLAPSSSTTTMLALGDAVALTVSRARRFQPTDFVKFHPGGSLGRKLATVEQCMRPLEECRTAEETLSVRETLTATCRPGRRSGAILVTGSDGRLAGIFTDSDLAKLLERRQDNLIDGPLSAVMTSQPVTIATGSMMSQAMLLLTDGKLSELPVVDEDGKPAGLIDITDVVGLTPPGDGAPASAGGPDTVNFLSVVQANISHNRK